MPAQQDPPLRRPVPVADAGSAAYWAGALEQRLLITRCEACRWYVHPPQPVCPKCFHEQLTAEEVSGRGQVYAFSVMHLPGVPGFEPPFAVAVVELEVQPGLLTVGNILDCAIEDISVGMAVDVAFEELNDTVTLPQWRPAEAR